MFEINGRKIKVSTGTRSQTVNICTSDNVLGEYESRVRLRPPFITESALRQANYDSIEDLVSFLCLNHSGQIEPAGGLTNSSGRAKGLVRTSVLTEKTMARETHDLLAIMGLKPYYRADVCSGIAGHFPGGTYDHNLPLYSKQIQTCFTDKARQIARPDLIVVDTKNKTVEVIVEFEIDTNPKNLIGNYFCVLLADEYKPKGDPNVYRLDVTRTAHFLLACLDPRGATPNEQAAVEKGKVVAEWLDRASRHLVGNVDLCKILVARAFADDDWQSMKEVLRQQLTSICPHLFDENG
jgi:hypothetical protein